MSQIRGRAGLNYLLSVIVVVILIILGSLIAQCSVGSTPSEDLIDALVAVSQVGGVVSGFTLTATAILSLGGQYREYVLKAHGRFVAFLLLLSFILAAGAAMVCALSPLIRSTNCLVSILGACVALIFGSLVTTSLLFYGAYSWNGGDQVPDKKRTPKPMDL